jgi:hypothetical protein
MSKPRIHVRKRKELHGDLNEAVGVDRASLAEMERMNAEFIASAKRMNIKPITLLFMTNQLREMVRKILFRQCLGHYHEVIGEPTEEEMEIIMKEFEKMCEIVCEESMRALLIKHDMRSNGSGRKPSPGSAPSGPLLSNGEQPYVPSPERPYYVN